jgi:hypothetical protein
MKATPINLALAGALALTACGIGASGYPDFSHTPAFRIEGVRTPVGGGGAQRVIIYRDGAKLRVETLVSNGRTIVVFDTGTNDAYALTQAPAPGGAPGATPSTATTLPLAPPPNAAGPNAGAPNAGAMALRVADAQAPQPLETPWSALTPSTASRVGGCLVANEGGNEWRATSTSLAVADRTACITPDGIVLREREGDKVIFQATRLDRGHPDPALFGVPPGYQRTNPTAIAESTPTATRIVANTGPAG